MTPDSSIEAARESRVAALWASFDAAAPSSFLADMARLAAERPGDACADFELASANDSCGREADAEPLYRRALAKGLTGLRRRRAAIQLASTLRNLGRTVESVAMLEEETRRTSDDLDDAVAGFLALSLIELDRSREAAALALSRLAPHLKRYNRSMARYSEAILQKEHRLSDAPESGPIG